MEIMCVQKEMYRNEVQKTTDILKCDKAAGIDGIIAQMLKYGEETVVEWMCLICDFTMKQREVPDEWKKAIIASLHKGRGSKDVSESFILSVDM